MVFEVGMVVGVYLYVVWFVGLLFVELFYEIGDLVGVGCFMDESYLLGFEGGVVDYLVVRYVIGVWVKVV